MTVTCPACGFENEVSGADADIACGRCETGLRAARGGRVAEIAPEGATGKPASKKGGLRIAVVAILLGLKLLFIAHHLLGGHRNPPPPLPVPAAPERIMLAYELFEPEELPPAKGLRAFAVKLNKLNPAEVRPLPHMVVTAGPRSMSKPVNPLPFQGMGGPQTITFTISDGEIPRGIRELTFRLMVDPLRAKPGSDGAESNAVTLKLRPER